MRLTGESCSLVEGVRVVLAVGFEDTAWRRKERL